MPPISPNPTRIKIFVKRFTTLSCLKELAQAIAPMCRGPATSRLPDMRFQDANLNGWRKKFTSLITRRGGFELPKNKRVPGELGIPMLPDGPAPGFENRGHIRLSGPPMK